jgi:hypothetical protein
MPGNLPKSTALSEIEEQLIEKGFPIVSHNAKLNNACNSITTFLYVFMAWFLITWRILPFPLWFSAGLLIIPFRVSPQYPHSRVVDYLRASRDRFLTNPYNINHFVL